MKFNKDTESFVELSKQTLKKWSEEDLFNKTLSANKDKDSFVFFEGPPSANGKPGIHHVMSRTIKDIFCRYKSQSGFLVERKAGWDTHGLPVELETEKNLGISKKDIGSTISVQEYNNACQNTVNKYTDEWNELTSNIGYWVDMDNPYVTCSPKYIESVWWILKEIYNKGLLYKSFTIQPYSPKAGTGLSSHELNQPGCYKDVVDTTITAQFKLDVSNTRFAKFGEQVYCLAWTTTPWTLPSNTALAVNNKIKYSLVETQNQYSKENIYVVVAESLISKVFNSSVYSNSDEAKIKYTVLESFFGSDLVGVKYNPLFNFIPNFKNQDNAYKVIAADFVSESNGTGIVHIAPTFGADDFKAAKEASPEIPPLLIDLDGEATPLVNTEGKFIDNLNFLTGKYVKNSYYAKGSEPAKSADVEIAIYLKECGLAFSIEKYNHSYPHCWRTDTPIIYYPLDSWFIKTKAVRTRMVELNNEIKWYPASTGTGRFQSWLENVSDWNLSRSRFWGIPLPVWKSSDGEIKVIGSMEELVTEINKSISSGYMDSNPFSTFVANDMSDANYAKLDLHKHIVDGIVLVSSNGLPMARETDLIDVWFDSGSMPYAQWHYPFENKEYVETHFPADFIAEGVDQTRGWFYTLHAISTILFDKPAYKNVISNGLVLDKNGLKMSKRLGNVVDPFSLLKSHSPDTIRWYMVSNSNPWDNLKFDESQLVEVNNKFFDTLKNVYSFFQTYASLDGYLGSELVASEDKYSELDLWILSELNSLIEICKSHYDQYDVTFVARQIEEFTLDKLSNWWLRLSRKRFWGDGLTKDKLTAYQLLHKCLNVICTLAAPIAPFYTDHLFRNLNDRSVHLETMPVSNKVYINLALQEKMFLAQKLSSMVLNLRNQAKIKVRQPLSKISVYGFSNKDFDYISSMKEYIKSEVNVMDIIFVDKEDSLKYKIIPNKKILGPALGKELGNFISFLSNLTQSDILSIKSNGFISYNGGSISSDSFEICVDSSEDFVVETYKNMVISLDTKLTEELINLGLVREFISKIQQLRKTLGYQVSDRIDIAVNDNSNLTNLILSNKDRIQKEVLAKSLTFKTMTGHKLDINGNLVEVSCF